MEKAENNIAFIRSAKNSYSVRLSVIIPVYNEEKNIKKCVESIIAQIQADDEILIINNNSTDRTLEICKNLQILNTNIYVYSEKKRGVSAARNRGLELARGSFVMFVDGDDYLPYGILSLLMKNAKNFPGKIVQGNILLEKEYLENVYSGEINQEAILESKYMQEIALYPIKYRKREKEWVLNSVYGVIGKIFPKAIISDMRFYEDTALGEDMLFYLETLHKTDVIIVLSNCVYVVNDHNSESSTRRINPMLAESVTVTVDRLIELCGKDEKMQENLNYQIFRHIEVGVLEQAEKVCMQKTVAEMTSYIKLHLEPRKEIYKKAYKVVLGRRFKEGIKRYILYYLAISFLKNEKYRSYCQFICTKEKIKRYKNGSAKKVN